MQISTAKYKAELGSPEEKGKEGLEKPEGKLFFNVPYLKQSAEIIGKGLVNAT